MLVGTPAAACARSVDSDYTRHMSSIDVVICTHNRAASLERCLEALARQDDVSRDWRVIVVDNNCTDRTRDVVAAFAARRDLPHTIRVEEPTPGLTAARLCGVRQSAADWVAFVDDDCMLASDWLREARSFAAAHRDAGGFGGRVVPAWGRTPPPHVVRHGWLFAEVDRGDRDVPVESLPGAGMVLNRLALNRVGWTAAPLLQDRIGLGHTSGGDVEICMRLAAAGLSMWYAPRLRLQHEIERSRQSLRGMQDLARGLGAGAELVSLMLAKHPERWLQEAETRVGAEHSKHLVSALWVLGLRYDWHDWAIRYAYLSGQRLQLRRLREDEATRARLGGCCARPEKRA